MNSSHPLPQESQPKGTSVTFAKGDLPKRADFFFFSGYYRAEFSLGDTKRNTYTKPDWRFCFSKNPNSFAKGDLPQNDA